jgi:hypothetical protein
MTQAEKHDVCIITEGVGECDVRFTHEVLVHRMKRLACVTPAVHKCDLHVGMVKKQPQHLAPGISRSAYYARFDFFAHDNFYIVSVFMTHSE